MVEHYAKIDLADLREHRATLEEGEGVSMAGALITLCHPGPRLRYRAAHPDGRDFDIDEVAAFAYTDTPFGGRRRWLLCPHRERRVRVLYGGKQRLFRCRKCYRLIYHSTLQAPHKRADTQADKLALKSVGGDRQRYDGETFPDKPLRMRWATYHRLEERYYDLKDECALGVMHKIGGILRRAL